MKKIILIILILLLIPFFIITIKDIDREEVNPTLTYNLTTTDSTYTDLNNHTLQVFDIVSTDYGYTLPNEIKSGFSHHDGKSYYVQRVAKYVITGNEVFSLFDGYTNVTYIFMSRANIPDFSPQQGTVTELSFFLETFNSVSNINDNTNSVGSIAFNGGVGTSIWLGFTKGTSLETAKSQLVGKTLYYQLATPIETELFDIDTITEADLDDWYTIYQTYHTTYTTLTLGTATPTTYTSLQQLIIDNDDKDFKLYRDDVVDETHYRLTQESGYISITNGDDLEIMRINDDDTFESSLQIDDTIDYKLVGYNVTSYIDGSFDNTILAFVWIIPILLIGGFFFIIFSHRKED